MKTFLTLLIFSLSLIFTTSAFANKKLYCSGSTTNGVYLCSWKDMKLYDQRIVSDMHCFPTAASMGLSEFTYGGESYYTSSWTAQNFIGKSEADRISNMGNLMNTTVEDGTGWTGALKYKARKSDFPDMHGGYILPLTNKIDNGYIKSRVLDRKVDMLGYGHWTEKCTTTLGVKICSFSRSGGHGTTVNGYTSQTIVAGILSIIGVQIYNPWNGVVKQYSISSVANNSSKVLGIPVADLRPYLGNTTMLYSDGDKKKIIESLVSLQSN